MPEKSLKILEFRAENVKRLKVVHITPDGNMIVLGGKNEQGKTSVLDAIMMALGGKKAVPVKPIREGEKFGEVFLDLGAFKVTRKFYADGESTITVEGSEGYKLSSPQAILDALVGSISFDPLEFYHMDGAKQAKTIQEVAGIDLSDLIAERESVFNTRTVRNRDLKAAEIALKGSTKPENAPESPVSLDDIQNRIAGAQAYEGEVEHLKTRIHDGSDIILDLEEEIAKKQAKLDSAKETMKKVQADLKELKKNPPDMEALALEHREAREANQRYTQMVDYLAEKVQFEKLAAETAGYTKRLSEIDTERAKIIKEAKLPISGLSIDEEGVKFEGIPFSQCSSAQALKVSVALALAMNTKLKVLLIRDGSLLDTDNLKMIAEMAAAADAQIWMERVGTDAATSVILVDGEVQK